MSDERPWKYDPLVFHFFIGLQHVLRRDGLGGATNSDLLDRVEEAAKYSQKADNSRETTHKRLSWCLLQSAGLVLSDLGVSVRVPSLATTPITMAQCEEMNDGYVDLESAVIVDCTEYSMGEPGVQRGPEQLEQQARQRRMRSVARARELVAQGLEFLRGDLSAAGQAGQLFFNFLVEHGSSKDELVHYGEDLVKVHV